jgi:hypothetical protein
MTRPSATALPCSHELDPPPTFSAWGDAVEQMFTMNIAQPLHNVAMRIRLEGATRQPLGYAL